jgi:hypothetical protein
MRYRVTIKTPTHSSDASHDVPADVEEIRFRVEDDAKGQTIAVDFVTREPAADETTAKIVPSDLEIAKRGV